MRLSARTGTLSIQAVGANLQSKTWRRERRDRALWLPKTPSELKMQWFRAFVRSWWYHDELSFCCPFALVTSSFRSRVALQAEILALRHQLAVFQKSAPRRLRLQRSDRLLWVLLSR